MGEYILLFSKVIFVLFFLFGFVGAWMYSQDVKVNSDDQLKTQITKLVDDMREDFENTQATVYKIDENGKSKEILKTNGSQGISKKV